MARQNGPLVGRRGLELHAGGGKTGAEHPRLTDSPRRPFIPAVAVRFPWSLFAILVRTCPDCGPFAKGQDKSNAQARRGREQALGSSQWHAARPGYSIRHQCRAVRRNSIDPPMPGRGCTGKSQRWHDDLYWLEYPFHKRRVQIACCLARRQKPRRPFVLGAP